MMVTRNLRIAASATDVWAVISGFQSLPNWHPGIKSSDQSQSADGELRSLTTHDGAVIVELELGRTETSYGYTITSSPLPVEDYVSQLSVHALGPVDTLVVWTSTFKALDAEAEGIIAGVYEGGFAALAERFQSS